MKTTEIVYVKVPIRVSFVIKKDPDSSWYHGHIRQYPGVLTQGKSPASVRRALVALLREIASDPKDDLEAYA